MTYHRLFRPNVSTFFALTRKQTKLLVAVATAVLLTLTCFAQDQPSTAKEPDPRPYSAPAESQATTVTIPAGTRIALVLTHPLQSRYIHHGDDIYAQVNSPVDSGDQVVIPPGTFVQGRVDRLDRRGGRAQLHLQSMSLTFPDGYVAPISGPVTLESSDGYALKDPGPRRSAGMLALPAAGAGLGALIGRAAANTNPGTLTNTLPPGCTGPPPGCLSSSVSVPAHPGMAIAMGAGIGAAVGMVSSLVFLNGTHNYFLDVGSPVEMTLPQTVTLPQREVNDAVRQAQEHPAPPQPISQRPRPAPVPDTPMNNSTCYTPDTPGTPATMIPGMPGPDGVPGPPTMIPGSPPIPGSPYPCP